MRRWLWLPLVVLCAIPMGAPAQTWSEGVPSYVVGNTLVAGTPPILLANGKGYGKGGPSRGGGAPAPSPSPAPSAAPSLGESRGESSFSYYPIQQPPIRVQLEGPSVQPLPAQPAPITVELPPITVQTIPAQVGGAGCCATLTIPVQILYRQPVAQVQPAPPQSRLVPTPMPAPIPPQVCPYGCVVPEVQPQAGPMIHDWRAQPQPRTVCNVYGECIRWP